MKVKMYDKINIGMIVVNIEWADNTKLDFGSHPYEWFGAKFLRKVVN